MMQSGGGGGFGDPRLRDPERVARDVREGYVSPGVAEEVYRVTVTPDGEVGARTKALRSDPPQS